MRSPGMAGSPGGGPRSRPCPSGTDMERRHCKLKINEVRAFHFPFFRRRSHLVAVAVEKFRLNYLSVSLHRCIRDLCAVAKMRIGFSIRFFSCRASKSQLNIFISRLQCGWVILLFMAFSVQKQRRKKLKLKLELSFNLPVSYERWLGCTVEIYFSFSFVSWKVIILVAVILKNTNLTLMLDL